MVGAIVLLFVFTIVGLIAFWPHDSVPPAEGVPQASMTVSGRVVSINTSKCQVSESSACTSIVIALTSGPDAGETTTLQNGETLADPDFDVGDRVRLAKQSVPSGEQASGLPPYSFADFERKRPLLLLVLIFSVIVIVFGRLRGFLALVGLGASVAVVIGFLVPAIIQGGSPLPVALVAAFLVMFLTIGLTHGIGPTAIAATAGTAVSLLFTALLAVVFTGMTNITGFSSEEATLLQSSDAISIQGLVLAGIVIAALGVLDDLTITQSSAVMALRRADPSQGARELYRGALEVGRDHVAATVNTLVLAYVGASLPVLLIFAVDSTSFSDAVNYEAVAEQIVGTLVGSIGLIAAVPLTTFIAAVLAANTPVKRIKSDAHAHHH